MRLDERLESLYRENVKLSEDISHIVDGNSDEMSLLDSIKVLAGLREASEESLNLSRSHSNSKGRNATIKKKTGSIRQPNITLKRNTHTHSLSFSLARVATVPRQLSLLKASAASHTVSTAMAKSLAIGSP